MKRIIALLGILILIVFSYGLAAAQDLVSEACRTPGYWATHAGTNTQSPKTYNVTSLLIASVGQLLICGQPITPHTDANNVDSATSPVEALCVSNAGNFNLQLDAELTAAALNCVANGHNADCSNDPLFAAKFAACNNPAVCATGTKAEQAACVAALDCLNNGGHPGTDAGGNFLCAYGTCSDNEALCTSINLSNCADPATAICDLSPNCTEQNFSMYPDSPAGSSKACKAAKRSACSPFTTFTNCSLP